MCLLYLVAALSAIVPSEFDHEVAYAGSLRDRALYRLSALQCNQLLGDSTLTPEQRVQVVIELSKTMTAQALNSRPPKREAYWQQTFELLTTELGRNHSAASALLLKTQAALTTLRQAEWTRRETEVRARTDADWELARSQIRNAIKQLKQVEAELNSPRMRAGKEGLSVPRVAELLRNTKYQLSRAFRNQAITYADRPADQASSLTLALQELRPLASDVAVDDLVWQCRIDQIECYRLRGDLERTSQWLAALQDAPDKYLGQLAAEGVRLALAAKRAEVAMNIVQSSKVASDHPEFELARIETLVAMAESDNSGSQGHRQQAADVASRLGRDHGSYWGLRGEMLLAKLAGSQVGAADTELLDTAAKTLLKQALPEDATEMFIRAAQQAERDGDHDKAFGFRHKAATVDHQQGDLQPAIDRFRDVALRYPQNPRAAESHLLASFNAAALYQQHARTDPAAGPKLLAQYEALLHEHLDLWPQASSSDQVRLWLGRLSEAKQDLELSIECYRGIRPGAEQAAEAYRRLGRALRTRLAAPAALELDDVRNWFEQRMSVERDPAAVLALSVESARLAMDFEPRQYDVAARSLRRGGSLISENSDSSSLTALLIVATAGQGRASEARRVLEKALPLPKDALLDVLRGLEPIRDAKPDDADLRSISGDVVKLLGTYQSQLSPTDHLLIDQALADEADEALALETYRRLATTYPQNLRVQMRLAELLSLGRDRASRDQALEQWRAVVGLSQPRSERWFRGKLGVAQAHFDKGDHQKAKQIVELLMTLYPDLGSPRQQAAYQRLLDRVKSAR